MTSGNKRCRIWTGHLCSQAKLAVLGHCPFDGVVGQSGSLVIPKQPRLILEERFTLPKLTAGPNCVGQHPQSSHIIEQSSCCLHRAFTSLFYSLWWGKTLCSLPEKKHKHQPSDKICDLQYPDCKMWLGNVGAELAHVVWMNSHCLVQLEALDSIESSWPILLGWPGTRDWIAQSLG